MLLMAFIEHSFRVLLLVTSSAFSIEHTGGTLSCLAAQALRTLLGGPAEPYCCGQLACGRGSESSVSVVEPLVPSLQNSYVQGSWSQE